jgi:hypothetical protein
VWALIFYEMPYVMYWFCYSSILYQQQWIIHEGFAAGPAATHLTTAEGAGSISSIFT